MAMSTPRKKRKLQKSDGPTVDIFGVKLPQFQEYEELPFPSLQPVQSTVDAIKQMAIGVSMGLPVLAVGPVGSGKTVAVEWLGRKVGRRGPHDFVKIQLSEDMDGKVGEEHISCGDFI